MSHFDLSLYLDSPPRICGRGVSTKKYDYKLFRLLNKPSFDENKAQHLVLGFYSVNNNRHFNLFKTSQPFRC